MTFKLFLQTIITLLLLVEPTFLMAESKTEAKMKHCHYSSPNDSEGKIIVISINALKAHLEHGDPTEYYVLSKDTCKKIPKKKKK